MKTTIKKLFDHLASKNILTKFRYKLIFYFFIETFILSGLIIYTFISIKDHSYEAAVLDFSAFLIKLILDLILIKKKKFKMLFRISLNVMAIFIFYLIYRRFMTYGAICWIIPLPMPFVFLLSRKEGSFFSFFYYILFGIFYYLDFSLLAGETYFITFSISYFFIFSTIFFFSKIRQYYIENLEKKNSELKKIHQKEIELHKTQAILSVIITANHEINQPLMILQGNLEMLKYSIEETNDKIENKFERIFSEISRINEILTKLEKLEKIEYTEYVSDVNMVDLEDEGSS